MITSAAPPEGGRSALTLRFTRHFNVMSVPDSSEETLRIIFSGILNSFLKEKHFSKEIIELGEKDRIVNSTLSMYFNI